MSDRGFFDWKGRLGPMRLAVSEHTFVPSTVSGLMAKAMEIEPDEVVIDVGCGTGILGIIAAKLGAGRVHATDACEDVVEVGSRNAAEHGVADRVAFYRGDLFEAVPEDIAADVILGDVSGIPDALAAESGWFPSRIGGGPRGSELPIRMLQEAVRRIKPTGRLLLPTGTLQDEASILETARSLFATVRKLIEKAIPLPAELAESASVRQLATDGIVGLTQRGTRYVWEARVWECRPA